MSDVESALAQYKSLLTFETEGDYTVIRLKEYVPKPKWDEINNAIHQVNGEYVGGIGKNVHWRVPRDKPSESYATIHCPYCNKPINFTVGTPKNE